MKNEMTYEDTMMQQESMMREIPQDESTEMESESVTVPVKRSSKIGAILRLLVSGVFAVVAVCAAFGYAFTGDARTVSEFFNDLFREVGAALLMTTIPWLLMKWGAYIFPKSLSWANGMWKGWIAITPIGLAVKAMIWLYILFLPFTLIAFALIPYGWISNQMLTVHNNCLISFAFMIGCTLMFAITIFMDVAKLKGCKLFDLIRKSGKTVAGWVA